MCAVRWHQQRECLVQRHLGVEWNSLESEVSSLVTGKALGPLDDLRPDPRASDHVRRLWFRGAAERYLGMGRERLAAATSRTHADRSCQLQPGVRGARRPLCAVWRRSEWCEERHMDLRPHLPGAVCDVRGRMP